MKISHAVLLFGLTSFYLMAGDAEDFEYIKKLQDNQGSLSKDVVVNEMEVFLKKYPNSKYYDTALYLLAFNYYSQNNLIKARDGFEKLKDGMYKDESYYFLELIALKNGDFISAEENLRKIDGKSSRKIKAYYYIAEEYNNKKDYTNAEKFYKIVLKENGEYYIDSVIKLGMIYYNLNEYVKSVAILEQFLLENKGKYEDKMPLVLYVLGYSSEKINDYDSAIKHYKNIIDNYKDSSQYADVLFNLVKYYSKNKNLEQTSLYVEKMNETKYKFDGMLILAELYYENKDYNRALEIYKTILMTSNDEKIIYKLTTTYLKMEKYDEALQAMTKLKKSSYTDEYYYYTVFILFKQKKYSDVLMNTSSFESDIGSKSKYYNEVSLMFGEAAYLSKNYEKSLFYYEKLYNSPTSNEDDKKKALYRVILISDALKLEEKEIKYYNSYIEKFNDDTEYKKDIYMIIANLYISKNRYLEAEVIYKNYLKIRNDDVITRNLVMVLMKQDKYSEMENYVKKLPDTSENSYLLAMTYLNSHNYSRAEEILKQLLVKEDNAFIEDTYQNLTDCLYSQNKYDEVLKYSNEYLQKWNGKYKSQMLLKKGVVFFKLKRYDEAIEVYNSIKESGESRDYAYFMIGEIYFNLKNYEKAKDAYNYVVINYPESTYRKQSLYWIINMYYEEKDYDKTIYYIKLMQTKYKDNEYSEDVSYYLANIYMEKKQQDQAIKIYEEIVNKTSKKELKESIVGKVVSTYYEKGKYDDANKWVNKMQESGFKTLWQGIILEKQGKGNEAVEKYSSIVGDPDNGDKACYYLGLYYNSKKQYEKAREYLNKVLDFASSEYKDTAVLNTAISYEEEGNVQKAIVTLMRIKLVYEGSLLLEKATIKIAQNYEKLKDLENAYTNYLEIYEKYKKSQYYKGVTEWILVYFLNKSDVKSGEKYYKELRIIDAERAKKYSSYFIAN